jgi:hypothetical protein
VELELAQLRREAAWQDLGNRIGDFVATQLIDSKKPITMPDCNRILNEAVARFARELPPQMIAQLVQAQISVEAERRRQVAMLPQPVKRDRFGRPRK